MTNAVINVDASSIIGKFRHFLQNTGKISAETKYTGTALRIHDYLSAFHNHCEDINLHPQEHYDQILDNIRNTLTKHKLIPTITNDDGNTHYNASAICKMVGRYCDVAESDHGINLGIISQDNSNPPKEDHFFAGEHSPLTPLSEHPSTDFIRKSSFNSYLLLSRLENDLLASNCDADGFGHDFGVLPTIGSDCLSVMIWNFNETQNEKMAERVINLSVNAIKFTGEYKVLHYRIDDKHSNSHAVWKHFGCPEKPSIDQIKQIRKYENLSMLESICTITIDSSFSKTLTMPSQSVSLLLLVPTNTKRPSAPKWIKGISEIGTNKNSQVFLKWEPCPDKDFVYYRIWRKTEDTEYATLPSPGLLGTSVYVDMEVTKGETYIYRIDATNASKQLSGQSSNLKITV